MREKNTCKILVAEDEQSNFEYISEVLKKLGHEVMHAPDGQKAVEYCKQVNHVDLILMDIKMPNMNGYEATREIRSFNPEVPIIAQTAFAFSEDRSKAIDAGCTDYLPKPIRPSVLKQTIRKYLD